VSSGIVETQGSGAETQQQQANRSRLVQRLLTSSSSLPQFVNDLVTTQAVVVAGTEAAAFIIERKAGGELTEETFSLTPIAHIRPDQSTAETRSAAMNAFQEIVRPCIIQNKDGAIEIASTDDALEPRFCLVTLLRNEGEVVAVSAVITRCIDTERAKQRLMSMQLVAGYFDLYGLKRTSEQNRVVAQSHQHVLQLASAVATAQGFDAAATNLCNELANRTGAVRVSLGWLKGQNVRIKGISHTEKFDKKQELVVELEKVMEECFDQDEMVKYDPDGGSSENVTREAAAFSRKQDGHIVLSLPLRRGEELSGVITLEFAREHKITPQAATGLAVAVDLLAPQLHDRYQNDRWLITKAGLSARDTAKLVIGPKHMLAKTIVALLLGAFLFVCLYSPMYHVAAPFEFAAVEKRALSAPFDGYIGQVLVKPGDVVAAGAPLIELRTEEMRLELSRARARALSHQRQAEHHRAAVPPRIAEMNVELARKEEAEAEVKYVERQIELASILAPIDGEILRGDLEDKIGAPVRQGDVLVEIGKRETLRAELLVAERDIQSLKEGGKGKLATSALPTQKHPFVIERITPISDAHDGKNIFRVYATLPEASGQWRPGMMGEARVEVGQRPLAWQWTHRLVDFVRLKLWI
jgi:biotin carboxyl carrier protein